MQRVNTLTAKRQSDGTTPRGEVLWCDGNLTKMKMKKKYIYLLLGKLRTRNKSYKGK